MTQHILGGVFAPVVTTFDVRTGDLDEDAYLTNVHAHIDAGLDGIVIAGSTGEAALLSERERRDLLDWSRAIIPDERWMIAGIGGESTRQTIARSLEAAGRGADAVLVVAPHYYASAMTHDALSAHFRAVADASPIPVILYNIPKYMHYTLEPALVAELATHGNIIGIKDSSGDMPQLGAYLQSQSGSFSVLTGHGGSLYAALELGARGGILAVALFAAELSAEVQKTFVAGDGASSARAQERLAPLAKAIVAGMGVAGVKAAMDAVGLRGGAVRSPLLPVSDAQRKQIAELLSVAKLAAA
ncbi:MAG: dihydrodipicolinate synthase family protein [Gemmatimonadota bacterium]|nr:dihydrodipicolinate synthase family protein [Gemmatimonadota bacterium]